MTLDLNGLTAKKPVPIFAKAAPTQLSGRVLNKSLKSHASFDHFLLTIDFEESDSNVFFYRELLDPLTPGVHSKVIHT